MNECINQLKVEQHPDKTFIGRIKKGFDFLGYHFSREPLRIANITVKKHVERFNRLYEQQKDNKDTSKEIALVLGQYVKRWQCWCSVGILWLLNKVCRGRLSPAPLKGTEAPELPKYQRRR